MSDNQVTFKCSRCRCFIESSKFGFNSKGNRNKTCIKCNRQRIAWNKTKKEYQFEMTNEWKEHPTIKGYYGNRNGLVVNRKTKHLVGGLESDGYLRIGYYESDMKHIHTHRFIWETFNSAIPEGKVINHINENKSDNRLENLELVTQSENSQKATKKITGRRVSKPVIGHRVTSTNKHEYKSMGEAERQTGCGHRSIQQVCDGIYNTVTSKTTGEKWIFKYK